MALNHITTLSLHKLCSNVGQNLRHRWHAGSVAVFMSRPLTQTTDITTHISPRLLSQGITKTCSSHCCSSRHKTLLSKACPSHGTLNLLRPMSSASIVSKVTKDIDLEKLREEIKRKSTKTGEYIQLNERVRELVAQRCADIVANFNEAEKKKLQVIQLEHNFIYSEGYDIPSSEDMRQEYWLEAMALPTKSQRLKYYVFLQRKMYLKEAERKKKAALKEEMKGRLHQEEYEHGRLFMRIYERTMRTWLNYRLASVMQHGTPLVIDMNYVDLMRPQEQRNTAHQLCDMYCLNRGDKGDPFHLHLTCCAPTNAVLKMMQIRLQDSPFFMATVTEKSYLDLFDKDKLIYLSPEGRQPMKEYDPEAVYIIGAFNDKATSKPVSYARAMEHGVKCQRLPLDEHLNWNMGSKGLTLDQVMRIMLDVKRKLPWKTALRAVPQRKLR